MSTRHFPYPQDFEVDRAAAGHEERRRRALTALDPGDVLAVIEDALAGEPDPAKHPLFAPRKARSEGHGAIRGHARVWPRGYERRAFQSPRTSAEPAGQERSRWAKPGREGRRAGEPGGRPGESAPHGGASWTGEDPLAGGEVGRRPPGSERRACRHRGHSGLWASQRSPGQAGRTRRGTGGPSALARAGGCRRSGRRHRKTKPGSRPGIGTRATGEATRKGPSGRRRGASSRGSGRGADAGVRWRLLRRLETAGVRGHRSARRRRLGRGGLACRPPRRSVS